MPNGLEPRPISTSQRARTAPTAPTGASGPSPASSRASRPIERRGPACPPVPLEAEHVRSVIVTRRVEALALLVQAPRVELGEEDPLLVPERAREVGAVGAED